jgi:EAL domain-containing protein (putative c-di-GMP-specific phosphodiesterase class I)
LPARRLPPWLKIDQSFVHGLADGDEHLASVIQAIVALGRSLGMTITAEGVETKDQALFLSRAGVDLLQGFYLGRPMPLERLAPTILADFRDEHGERRIPEVKVLRAIDG